MLGRSRYSSTSKSAIKKNLADLGCIMWFPLDSDSGLKDIIGKKVIGLIASYGVSWSPAYGMFQVSLGGKNIPVADINVKWTEYDFEDQKWTSVIQAKRHNNPNVRGSASVFKTNHKNIVSHNLIMPCVDGNLTTMTGNWSDDDIHTTTIVGSDGGRKIYHNGELVIDDKATYQFPWGCSKINIAAYDDWTAKKMVFVKNAMLFNRALTDEEVKMVNNMIR